jgi:thioredoxin reductase (NADPH)
VPAWLLLKGSIAVLRRDGLQHETALTNLGPGQFTGEVSQLVGATTLASVYAGHEGCTALPFDATHVRALMIGSAEVGEIMMRTFGVGLIEEGGVGAVLEARPLLERSGVLPEDLPISRVSMATFLS